MKNRRGLWVCVFACAIVALGAGLKAYAEQQSKYALNGNILFTPAPKETKVVSIYASNNKGPTAALTFYARGGAGKKPVTGIGTTTRLLMSNGSGSGLYYFTNSDHVVYMHAAGSADYRTVSSATWTSVTLSAAIATSAWSAADMLYEITSQSVMYPTDTLGTGTNRWVALAGDIYATPPDSPLYVTFHGSNVTVTVDK